MKLRNIFWIRCRRMPRTPLFPGSIQRCFRQ
nr:MAG TPA: hypothetical protein [Caudoviricetes sp.]